ncbi:MAG: hypothetical protein K6A36_06005 [Paludibacteraceae bacterium]|nr:hypothetical protein [Paludibacteraceae bacterium]
MKNNQFALLLVAILFSSCSQVYHYVQVFEASSSSQSKPIKNKNGGMVYEDNNCMLFYSLWKNGGDASFAIYNKTNEIMYIDLSKSFFIRNGIANDYYKGRAWNETNTNALGTQTTTSIAASEKISYSYGVGATYLGDFGVLPYTTSAPINTSVDTKKSETYGLLNSTAITNSYATSSSSSISIAEQKIMAIPPHSSKIILGYSISTTPLRDCELNRFPEEKASITFTEDNSPLIFSNYTTYHLGENTTDIVIENKFYISKVTNYAQPSAYTFIERPKRPCQNLTDDDSKDYEDTYPVKVYDKVYNLDCTNCFFLEYSKQSKRKLYKKNKQEYYYDEYYDGWTLEGSDEQIEYRQRLLNPFVKQ